MDAYLNIAIIIVSIALITAVILQSRGAGLGGLTGGDTSGGGYHARRGVEKLLFNVTIGLSIVFFILAVLTVIQIG
ncbi:MAG: preprotein translocase subunit SecG [Chloroflexi bacterium RBG_16_48_8]|nr:MAG: preprotein translocase subunit SecG [Chloroflexi bacterium RBG_16_48_8]